MATLRLLYIETDADALQRAKRELADGKHNFLFAQDVAAAAEILLGEPLDGAIIGPGIAGPDVADWVGTLRAIERRNRRPTPALIVRLVTPATKLDVLDKHAVVDFPWSAHGGLTPVVTLLCTEVLAGSGDAEASGRRVPEAEVLEVEQFREQVGYDDELLVEIINLFLAERKQQVPEMRATLEAGNFDLFSRQVHTIKGSLSSLHASVARARAQDLETAAKARDADSCHRLLGQLEDDLNVLEDALLALRASISTL